MTDRILYLGDTALNAAAAYLAGVMTHHRLAFDYRPSDEPVDAALLDSAHRLYVLSDYASSMLEPTLQRRMVERVAAGDAGLLMIGGWESYCGLGGDWASTPIAAALPVRIAVRDDRVNCDQPALPRAIDPTHPTVDGLPWADRPPTIGGFNRFTAKQDAQVVLEIERFRAKRNRDGAACFESIGADPLLVVGRHGAGRVAALATDVAPHWVGGFVDWGDQRVNAAAPGGNAIEVGDLYARFLIQLTRWTASADPA